MTPDEFRDLVLGLPQASEGSHQGHADFRVGGKVFATLGPDETWGMVKVTPEDQQALTAVEPDAYEVIPGAWGRQGCTRVNLAAADAVSVGAALKAAWRNVAPDGLLEDHGDEV